MGSALAMLFVPYIAKNLGPKTQFNISGLTALAWLAMWSRVGSDCKEDNCVSSNSGGSILPPMTEEGGMDSEPAFNKKEDLTPLMRSRSHSNSNVEPTSRSRVPWGVLIRSSAVWAILSNNFAFHYATYVLMSWLPTYFQGHIRVGLSDVGGLYTVSVYKSDRCSICFLACWPEGRGVSGR